MNRENTGCIKDLKYFSLEPIAYYNKNWKDFDMLFHSHAYYEIMYVEEGECDVHIYSNAKNLAKKETIHLMKDMAILITPEIFHRLTVKGEAKILNIEFECRKEEKDSFYEFSKIVQASENLKRMFSLDNSYYVLRNANDIKSSMKRIQGQLALSLYTKSEREILLYVYISELIIKLGKLWENSKISQGVVYVKRAIGYIDDHFSEELTVEKIANYLNVSKGYLHKIVKQEVGKTLVEIINEFRINRAVQLLKSTELPIYDIAIECGFNNRQNFYYAFRKKMGISAENFRKAEHSTEAYSFGDDYRNIILNNINSNY